MLEHDRSVGLVQARVRLRGLAVAKGLDEIRSTVDSLVRMKDEVEQKRRATSPPGRKAVPVLEVRNTAGTIGCGASSNTTFAQGWAAPASRFVYPEQ